VTFARGKRAGVLFLFCAAGCTSSLEVGERLYREGDRLAALETWQRVPADASDYKAVKKRVAEVEREFHQLVLRYEKSGHYFEEQNRLAESILNYRLALKLNPGNLAVLDHVQRLARDLAQAKLETSRAFEQHFSAGRLAQARSHLNRLRRFDPFDPELENEERQLEDALVTRIRSSLARGRSGFTSGNYQRAERAFRAVLELDPDNESAQGYLSYIRAIRSVEEKSGVRLEVPPDLFASNAEIRAEGFYQNARAAEAAGDPYTAISHDLEALKHHPAHAGAQQHLNELRERLRPQVEVLLEAGRTAFQQEDLQTALDYWRRAALIEPDNTRVQDYMSRAEKLLEGLEQLRSDTEDQAGNAAF